MGDGDYAPQDQVCQAKRMVDRRGGFGYAQRRTIHNRRWNCAFARMFIVLPIGVFRKRTPYTGFFRVAKASGFRPPFL
jgi:hypothetical protein